MVNAAPPSASKERREAEKLATREKILEAAREMFNEVGIEACTMRAIADRIGYTATAIYYHFKDKDALCIELCHRDFGQLGKIISQAGRIEDPVERIRRVGLAYIDFGIENPAQYKFMFMTMKVDHSPEEVNLDKNNPEESAYTFLQVSVADAINAGRIRPELCEHSDHIANLLWSAVHGVVSLHMVKCHDSWVEWGDPRELGELMVDTVIRGITSP